ncbi:MAG TPA: HEAT repeat domain-containing protein [Spirochaetota bacterium]|nr:HEAT repeat domain-containing protein [Spirochaetota bacterium]
MKKNILPIMLAFIIAAAPGAMAGDREDRLYNSIMKEAFIPEKSRIAEELGRLGTADAKAKLLGLLGNQSYWNRTAAVRGLFALPDSSAGPALLKRMLSDHMIDDEIAAGFRTHLRGYYEFLTAEYRKMPDQKSRDRIIDIISSSKTPLGEAFLKSIIDDEGSGDRENAFKSLAACYPSGNYQYIKGRRDIPLFRVHALTHIVDRGTPDELAIFRAILDKREEVKYRLIAYKAVNKWGDDAYRHRVFMESLREGDENLVQGGIMVFTGVRSDAVKTELCRVVKKGKFQMTRMEAALKLRDYTSPDVVPPLIMILKEDYIQRERGGADIFATIITFGISSVFDDISRKHQRRSFDNNKLEIVGHLKRITGADNGPYYGNWYEWAILNGYTIRGDNIIQKLFSGYRPMREKAVESAIRLLGHSSTREFFARNGSFTSDTELSLALAKMLIARGFLKEEE